MGPRKRLAWPRRRIEANTAMTRRPSAKFYYELDDRRALIPPLVSSSLREAQERYLCPGSGCGELGQHWHLAPSPVNITIEMESSCAWVDTVADINIDLLHKDLYETIRPYCSDVVVGTVSLRTLSNCSSYISITAANAHRVRSDRGRHCRHAQFPCCKVWRNEIGWASGAIVERDLDGRPVCIGHNGNVLVESSLAKRLELSKRFPRLWLYRIDVVEKPLDGEVLPGDPEWDGVFRPAPPPQLPGEELKRGRVTHD